MNQPGNALLDAIAAEVIDALTHTRQISPFAGRPDGLTVKDAYGVILRGRIGAIQAA